ncbi:hypothetical protein RRG08_040945 [Elysia crispata]|uniref:Uncharacterized protein n=1 Tax=Elysia crispata TaxID=231223 RepID=A0AAE1ALD5_9GAST|nr:hypothetical protein RRG08_040945 [Elysia crispata]
MLARSSRPVLVMYLSYTCVTVTRSETVRIRTQNLLSYTCVTVTRSEPVRIRTQNLLSYTCVTVTKSDPVRIRTQNLLIRKFSVHKQSLACLSTFVLAVRAFFYGFISHAFPILPFSLCMKHAYDCGLMVVVQCLLVQIINAGKATGRTA